MSSKDQSSHSAIAQIEQVSAGALAAALTRSLTQPFDVLKIRFQLQVEPLKTPFAQAITMESKYTSLSQACRLIYREEGLPAFWKGHNAGQIMSIMYGIMQFWSYEQLTMGLSQISWLHRRVHVVNFVSGGMAGCIATLATHPFDVIRTRFVAQDPGAGYKTILGAFPIIWRNEGIRGLYRGFITSIVQVGPLVGSNFMFYNNFKSIAKQLYEPRDGHLPTWCLLICGGSSGIASKAVVYPLDFIKKRLQLQGFEQQRQTFGRNLGCTNFFDCVKLTLREEGLSGFYKGMTPTLLKSGFTTGLYFGLYDQFKYMLGAYK